MRFIRHSLTGLFLVAVTLGLIVYAGALVRDAVQARLADEPRMPQARERVFAVTVVRASPETITPILSAFGDLRSRRTVEVRAATPGRIIELAPGFEDGATVEAGQILARIDPANAQSALDRASNDLSDAGTEARDADRAIDIARDTLAAAEEQAVLRDRALARQTDLRDRGVGSAALVEEAELAAASARQSVLSARNALAQAETRVETADTALSRARIARDEAQRDLDDTTVRAPFAGTLTEVAGVEGGLVSANEMLAQLIDSRGLEVAFRVSTSQYARLLDDRGALLRAPLTVTLDVQGVALTADGTITRDSAAVAEGQTGRMIFATLDQPRGLKPGDFVTVAVVEPPLAQVMRLPATALDAAANVLVLGEGDRLETMATELIRRQGDDVLVRAAALAGRDVVAQRTPLLGPGIKVRAVRPAGGEAAAQAPDAFVELTPERREKLKAFVSANQRLPEEVRSRMLAQLDSDRVPVAMVERLESRMGG